MGCWVVPRGPGPPPPPPNPAPRARGRGTPPPPPPFPIYPLGRQTLDTRTQGRRVMPTPAFRPRGARLGSRARLLRASGPCCFHLLPARLAGTVTGAKGERVPVGRTAQSSGRENAEQSRQAYHWASRASPRRHLMLGTLELMLPPAREAGDRDIRHCHHPQATRRRGVPWNGGWRSLHAEAGPVGWWRPAARRTAWYSNGAASGSRGEPWLRGQRGEAAPEPDQWAVCDHHARPVPARGDGTAIRRRVCVRSWRRAWRRRPTNHFVICIGMA